MPSDASLDGKTGKSSRLVQVAPDSESPETRSRLSASRGLLIAAGAAAVFWGAVAAVVVAVRHSP